MIRRHFLTASLGSLAFTALGGSLRRPGRALAQCAPRTLDNIEGPFYLPGSPARINLSEESSLLLSGTVKDTRRRPMADAVMEVWHADPEGDYDLTGFRFRGLMRTDAQGRYGLATERPGHYLNGPSYRPAHIHMKVHGNGRPPLTTQLYFPGDPYNDSDPWFRSSLQMDATQQLRGYSIDSGYFTDARFDFIL